VLLAGLGKSVWDFQSEQVRSHQADWAPLLKWLKKAG
jgi:chromosome partitioning protein